MTTETVTLDRALAVSEQLSPSDQLRLISVLSERLRAEVERTTSPVDLLTTTGLGAELWQQVNVEAYLSSSA
jgi:hypothetical protein